MTNVLEIWYQRKSCCLLKKVYLVWNKMAYASKSKLLTLTIKSTKNLGVFKGCVETGRDKFWRGIEINKVRQYTAGFTSSVANSIEETFVLKIVFHQFEISQIVVVCNQLHASTLAKIAVTRHPMFPPFGNAVFEQVHTCWNLNMCYTLQILLRHSCTKLPPKISITSFEVCTEESAIFLLRLRL